VFLQSMELMDFKSQLANSRTEVCLSGPGRPFFVTCEHKVLRNVCIFVRSVLHPCLSGSIPGETGGNIAVNWVCAYEERGLFASSNAVPFIQFHPN
jgi:hypothetical protein